MTRVYYNEIEPFCVEWLRNLIDAELLPSGDVDDRSITEVQPSDLKGYTQCHFFAGIGGWSLAARMAGWPDDKPLWTGSCPCQPFSVAGKGKGTADERHLWPEFFRLIDACRPPLVAGEQVAAAIGRNWLDGVHSDMEGSGYSLWAPTVPACAVDAPHRRDRLWFVAYRNASGPLPGAYTGLRGGEEGAWPRDGQSERLRGFCASGSLEHPNLPLSGEGRQQRSGEFGRSGGDPDARSLEHDTIVRRGQGLTESSLWRGRATVARPSASDRCAGVVSNTSGAGLPDAEFPGRTASARPGHANTKFREATTERDRARSHWSDAEWIIGHDGKARRVKPGIRLLAHGIPGRVGQLRAYGNAIVPQVAAEILGAWLDVEGLQEVHPQASPCAELTAFASSVRRLLEALR